MSNLTDNHLLDNSKLILSKLKGPELENSIQKLINNTIVTVLHINTCVFTKTSTRLFIKLLNDNCTIINIYINNTPIDSNIIYDLSVGLKLNISLLVIYFSYCNIGDNFKNLINNCRNNLHIQIEDYENGSKCFCNSFSINRFNNKITINSHRNYLSYVLSNIKFDLYNSIVLSYCDIDFKSSVILADILETKSNIKSLEIFSPTILGSIDNIINIIKNTNNLDKLFIKYANNKFYIKNLLDVIIQNKSITNLSLDLNYEDLNLFNKMFKYKSFKSLNLEIYSPDQINQSITEKLYYDYVEFMDLIKNNTKLLKLKLYLDFTDNNYLNLLIDSISNNHTIQNLSISFTNHTFIDPINILSALSESVTTLKLEPKIFETTVEINNRILEILELNYSLTKLDIPMLDTYSDRIYEILDRNKLIKINKRFINTKSIS